MLAGALACLERIAAAATTEDAIAILGEAATLLGASSATFVSFVRDDALLASYRTLHVGDPAWPAEYARGEWFVDDPWLRYARHQSEPALAREIDSPAHEEQAFQERASRHGYASALIAPAPSPQGQSRVGVLCLGAATPDAFDESLPTRKLLARSLAMELHAWMRRAVRDELIRRSRITDADIELLRHELAGRGSKVIASLMDVEGKTIDARFQRVSAKLGVPNRRAAVRLALLYGLL